MNANLSFSSATVLLSLLGFFVIIGVVIFILRYYLNNASKANLTKLHKDDTGLSTYSSRNKYAEVDAFQYRGLILNLSLILMLGLTTMLFNWTTYEETVEVLNYDIELDEEIVVEPPRTKEPPPPPPPPPPPVIEEVPSELLLEEESVEFIDQSLDVETEVIAPIAKPEKKADAPPPPPPPRPIEPKVEEIFKVVEEMPRFPGCEDMAASNAEKKACADKKLYEYIYKHLKYPSVARQNNIAGMVVIQFVVEKDGQINGAKVVRDIGGGCGQAALKIVNQMNEMPKLWIPGKQRGRPVRVMFNLPVRFKLINT